MLKRGNSGPVIFAAVLTLSAIAHVWAVASLFQQQRGEFGSTEVATAAISVNLETSDVIDATETAAAKEAASSPAGAPAEASKEHPAGVKDGEVMPAAETEDTKLQTDEEARMAARADAERQRDTSEVEIQKKEREKTERSAAAGGAGTTGATEAQESQGRVSASQGSILNYGASLRALIFSNTPRNIRKTSLRLAFSIAPSGGLSAVGVLRPSNNPQVDKEIVEIVRKLSARFPPPPPGASAKQLSYNIEIIFR